jgi:hypothetical protein
MVSGVLALAITGLGMAALGGRDELEQCEAALRAALPTDEPYFRVGYRLTQGAAAQRRTIHLVFFRPVHGLAVCKLRYRQGRYALQSIDIEMTLPGGPPAPVP